ncbi:hypothetical protein [Methanobrevibacter arboriphilus]|uniref:hypothetical protein n=1 Tax=Methanobrevibacter arboriphilus TaxID=39441 RepID=UPI000B08A696|nr:hypothetical protein [Methanobrevibacter arboriphilus]
MILSRKFIFFKHNGENFVKHTSIYKVDTPKNIWINYDDIILDESKGVLDTISKNLGLGIVSLRRDVCDIYPPSFYIKADPSLNAKDRIKLYDIISDKLYAIFQKEDKLDYLKKFFFKLDFKI